ncbi:MAG: C-terminal target protein [Flavipsychrobacter sp.]|nr:C-terminal target protein [Flavipsychrobacter sp.]
MKKLLLFVIVVLFAVNANAQYYITSSTWQNKPDTSTSCNSVILHVTTNIYSSGLSIKTYYGDGTNSTALVKNGGGFGYSDFNGDYTSPGTYRIKHVLYSGLTPIDSFTTSHEGLYCQYISIKCYQDISGSGSFIEGVDKFSMLPIKIEVSKNSLIVDTISIFSGTYYALIGGVGDVYSLKVIPLSTGLTITTPISGIIYDTIKKVNNSYVTKYFGFLCSGISGNDLSVTPSFRAGSHHFGGKIFINNNYCNSVPGTLTMQLSSRYNTQLQFIPSPTSISGNTVTWDFTSLSLLSGSIIYADMERSLSFLPKFGDTLMTRYSITPILGDANPSDNIVVRVDTARSGYDPNQVSVEPGGNIASGTKLQYTIDFENTGNDTAFNISVYDTLSPYVDMSSLELVAATSVMNIAVMTQDGYNLVKFDFPNINLLDSSHHGECDGAVIFTVNTKQDLPDGTRIDNRAGIYFDYNDVVMTNTVTNIIGIPSGIAPLSADSHVQLFPNPVNDILTIGTTANAYSELSITNTIGQSILTQTISTPQTKVNVKALSSGLYYITLRGESGIKVQKFEKL